MTSLSIRRVLRHEYFYTDGRQVADTLADQLTRRELSRYDKALHSVAYCCDEMLSNPHITPTNGGDIRASIADRVLPGEVIILFADANPKRGYLTGNVSVSDVLEAATQSCSRRDRLHVANAAARRIGQDVRPPQHAARQPRARTAVDRHRDLIIMAANVFQQDEIAALHQGTDGVPILALIGDTRATGITSGKFVTALTALPGDWLGTSVPAGRC